MGEREKTCCFSGHRPDRLPWGTMEGTPGCAALKTRLRLAVEQSYDRGMRHFLCGMARGCDFYFAEAVLDLRRQRPDITLEAAVPCATQSRGWPEADQRRYRALLASCDRETLIQEQYTYGCMQRRNRYMVDHSGLLLAVYDGSPTGGTCFTIRYALQRGVPYIELRP